MSVISSILNSIFANNERRTHKVPAFYFMETSAGHQTLVGTFRPRDLRRVQSTSTKEETPRWDQQRELFNAVYWSSKPLPRLADKVDAFSAGRNGTQIIPIEHQDETLLREYFADIECCLIGNEEFLDAAIESGEKTVHVALWNATDTKLSWHPCHRVVLGVESFQPGWMVCFAREHLFFRDVTTMMREASGSPLPYDSATAEQLLKAQENETVVMLAITAQGAWRIHSGKGWANGVLEHLHPALREVPVVQLHHIILPKLWSLDPVDVSHHHRVEVVTNADETVAALGKGAQVAYLLSPIGSELLRDLIKQGQMLPAQSVALDIAAEVLTDAE
jgi:hypothetical protein